MKKIFIIIAMAIVAVATQAQVVFLDPEGKEYADGQTMTINSTIDPDWGDVVFEAPDIKNVGDGANVYLNVDIKALPANTAVQECFGTNCYYFNLEGAHDTQSLFVGAGVTRSTATQWQCYDAVNDDFIYGVCTVVFTAYVNGAKSCAVTVNYLNSDPAGINTVTINDLNYILNSTDRSAIVSTQSTSLSGAISIPSSVTYSGISYSVKGLASKAFQNCDGITSVTIPSSISELSSYCFEDCDYLTSVTIPTSVTSIGDYCFWSCGRLSSINIPDNVKTLGKSCFAYTPLQTITIPSSVTSIGSYCFYYCSSLTNATINANVTYLPLDCFYSCSSLTSVSIPSSVTSLGNSCFLGCSKLSSITLPSGLKKLDYECFSGCSSLTEISLPASITNIYSECFSNCTGLSKLTCNATTPPSVGSDAFSCTLYQYGTLLVPSSAVSAYQAATTWKDWKYVKAIGSSVGTLTNATIGGLNYLLDSSDRSAIVSTQSTSLSGAISIPSSVTYSGTSYSVKGLASKAFRNCDGITSVTIPSSITALSSYCFYDCDYLTSVTIPTSVTSIGDGCFYDCDRLSSISIPSSVKTLRQYCFAYTPIQTITIPSSVTSIGSYCFYQCSSLTNITIPSSVTSIGSYCFEYCSKLSSITLPSGLKTLGSYCFRGCSALTEISLPASVTNINSQCFYNCAGLSKLTCNATTPPSVSSDAFSGTLYQYGTLLVPSSAVSAYQAAATWKEWKYIQALVTENNVYLTDATTAQNTTKEISVSLKNDSQITNFQFDVYLPEGVTMATSEGDYVYAKGTRLTNSHSITCAQQSDGAYRFICYSASNALITGSDGEIMNFTVQVPSTTATGDYTITIRNAKVAETNGTKYTTDETSAILTVKSEEPDVPSDIEPSTDISAFTNALYFNDVENRAGDFNLELNLKCAEENITAFQCDVYLPEGVEWKYTVDKRGKIIYDLPAFNEDRTDASYHTIAPIEQKSDGSYSIIVYSGEEEYILDLDGAIMTLPLTVSEEMEAGDYNIIMKNIVIVPTEGSKISIDRMVSRLTVPSYMIGDANGDDAIDVADIVATIAYMRNHPSENFIFAAADVNEDNAIDVADIVGIIRIMRSTPATSASKHNSARLVSAVDAEAGSNLRITPFAVEQGTKEKTVTLDMNNPGEEFTAFQCDVYFPEGIEWKTTVDRRGNKKVVAPTFNVEADRTNALYHTIDAGYNADGSMSVIVYSSDMEIILDEKGAILDLPFVFDENLAAGVYDIKLKNVKLSRVDATKAEPADYTFSVVVGSPSGDIALKGDYTGTNDALKLLVDDNSANVTCENLLLDDEDGYTVSNTFTAENVSYSRPMANEWGTVCLPFEIESNDNIQLYALSAVDSESSTGVLTFTPIESAEAGQAVVFKKKDDKGIDVTTENAQLIAGDAEAIETKITNWAIKGSYTQTTIQSNVDASGNTDRVKRYYIAQDKFWNAKLSATVPAFRAWFENSEEVASAAKSSYTIVVEDGETTSVLNVNAEGELEECTEIYDLSGKKLNRVVKGQVNIINGKKIFVK